ncbi:M23 family metallopeptidase [Pseudotabrizicola sediminis]|uniref:M23 family metallopeptidase n=1 Tax=Pseudotabrizicola sediminis TaxID=2486418 RepID=A0ABY2KLN2_9RHOB|nr:M23 family metallopeptidase [Pseudotabrizicola sediminis]TGD41776.1 M23 family metallopeptidase [Pseudotabrizicola sediminis]
MKLRYWTALFAAVCLLVTLAVRENDQSKLQISSLAARVPEKHVPDVTASDRPDANPRSNQWNGTTPDALISWSGTIRPGGSLDILLTEAGVDASVRSELSRVIGSEYDLRRLQPGYRLTLKIMADGKVWSAMLEVEKGLRVYATLDGTPSVRTILPELETVTRAGEAEIASSIYAALETASIPTRFASDLELILDGTLDLRRAVNGGERLRIVWRENRLGDEVIGVPTIDYAEIDLGAVRFEVIWPGDQSSHAIIYKDNQIIRVFDQPIPGARLSSSFGMREHPVHGGVRMHSGVDFAAEFGSPVHATQSGTLAFVGLRSGYGLMVEIDHPENVPTIYAHLSAASEAISVGQRIAAGEEIGRVGSRGTSTAPHLHYEIIVNGTPVPPLADDRLGQNSAEHLDMQSMQMLLVEARSKLTRVLATNLPGSQDQGG